MIDARLAAVFSAENRLLTLDTPLTGAALLVERFNGREAVSEPFRFEIDCLSIDAGLDLASLLGDSATLGLLLADGGRRHWHGHVTEASQLGADGGFARYRLVLEPWLAFLGLRRDIHLFQDKTVLDILAEVFAGYPAARWRSEVMQPLRRYSRLTQYRESDLDFVARLLAAEGLSYRFEHDAGGHGLVVFDRDADLPDGAQPVVRFHRSDATEASDTLQVWHETRTLQATAVSLAGWDYKTLVATAARSNAPRGNSALPLLERHDASEAYPFDSAERAQRHADLMLASFEAAAHAFEGHGSVRQLAPASRILLTQHDALSHADARVTILAVEHHGANNLDARAAPLLRSTGIEAGSYRNRLRAQPAGLALVPAPRPRPAVRPQTALVVGHPGAPLITDRDHRIRIQFSWQRGAAPNPGGLPADETGKPGDAPGDASSGTWVRVAEWLAGPDWGSHFLPRIGTEVLVDFIDGDIDRPLVVGQAYNGAGLPPFSAGVDGTANHPGTIAGWMSRNPAEGFNQWLVDDAPGQLRTRLATSAGASQLGLGHLIHQAPDSATRGAWRGSGFELRTDGWLAVRAGEGILLSASARSKMRGSQLDASEALARLDAAREAARTLADAARAHGIEPPDAAAQADLLRILEPARDGTEAAPGRPTPRFAASVLLVDAPADIGHSTPASVVAHAGAHLHATAHADFHVAAGHTFTVSAGQGVSGFTHQGGIRSIAQSGLQSIQAHDGPLEILADQAVTITSSHDEIHILAKDRIVLQAGQSAVTLEGQDITFSCPGTFSVKGSAHAFEGPGSAPARLQTLPADSAAMETPSPLQPTYSQRIDATALVEADWQFEQASCFSRVNAFFAQAPLGSFPNQRGETGAFLLSSRAGEADILQTQGSGWTMESAIEYEHIVPE